SAVVAQWDQLKASERDVESSALQGLPRAAAALGLAQETLRRAASAGFAWPQKEDVLAKLHEEVGELAAATTAEQRRDEFGDILLNLANYARYVDIDAEEALRLATQKFRRRFESVELSLRRRGLEIKGQSRDGLMEAWAAAKDGEARP